MNKTIKKKWLAALRSDKFTQGEGSLKRTQDGTVRHCCLGVLCEAMGVKWKKPVGSTGYYSYKGSVATLPQKIMDEAKISLDTAHKLIEMNDEKKRSFKQIASYIERYL